MREAELKVLLIEHDPDFTGRVQTLLGGARDLSATIRTEAGLKQGLSAVASEDYDVVLCDVCVPDGAGLANVFLLRAHAPQLPIIVAGDSDDEAMAIEAVHAGAQDYLVKSQLTGGWLERSIRYAIERQHLDQALLAAEQKYHSVFDHLTEGIFQTSPEGRYLMANAALAKIYGYDSPEHLVQSLTDISRSLYVEPGRRAEFIALMQEQEVITAFESQIYRKDGSIIWISENCRAVRESSGRLLYFEGTVEDITQRRKAEEQLRRSEALYQSLVETLPQNVFRKDLEGRFTFANQQFCSMLGRPLEDIIGKTDCDFFPPHLAAQYQKDDRKVLESGKPYEAVEEHLPPSGERMFVQVVKTPIYDDGKLLGLQGIFWDITKQRNAEERLRQANCQLEQSRKELRARNEQMEEDLSMAREIQQTMLPHDYPVFRGCCTDTGSRLRFTHRYLPTGSVGGDFFSVSAISEHQAGVFLCDVAGHGVKAALVTAMIRALVEELKGIAEDPGVFLTKLNADLWSILKHAGSPMLTTAVYLVADCKTGTVRYANAGHPKPLHIHTADHKVSLLPGAGTARGALGLFQEATYSTAYADLVPGDRVILFTDGLVEIHGQDGQLYTFEMLQEQIKKHLDSSTPALFDHLLRSAAEFSGAGFQDDVCLLGLDYA